MGRSHLWNAPLILSDGYFSLWAGTNCGKRGSGGQFCDGCGQSLAHTPTAQERARAAAAAAAARSNVVVECPTVGSAVCEHHGPWHAAMPQWPPLPAPHAADHGQLTGASTKLHWTWTRLDDVRTQAHHAPMPHVLHARADAARQPSRPVHVSSRPHLLLFPFQ
ncbi:hypothetical protein GQ600_24625 [Phytophthora cactorum]|nr:hypothetical protein GQ600_24625 [Phytophthora cactorum]